MERKGVIRSPPRVVHPDVQSPELLPDLVSRLPDLPVRCNIGHDVEKPGAGLVPHGSQMLPPFVADVQDRHVHTFPKKPDRDREPDPPGSSRHHRHSAHHERSLLDRRLPPPVSREHSLTLTFPDGYTTVVPMRRTRYSLVFLTAAAFLVVSCSTKLAEQPGLTDTGLFTNGQQYLAKKKYSDAAEHYKVLLEKFPNSPLAPKAQLALADAYMEDGDNVEAEVAYDDFMRLYPASDNVSYALFQKGELFSSQASKPGRDQGKTLEAIRTYKLILEKYPSAPYAETATRRVGELRNRLAEHEVYVVTHYLARNKTDSAEARAKRALSDYPDTTSVPTLMSLLAEALAREGKKEESAAVSQNLREKYLGPGEKKR